MPQAKTGELRRSIPVSKNAFRRNSPAEKQELSIESPKQTKLISLKKGFFSTNHKIFSIKPKCRDDERRLTENPDHCIARDSFGSQQADHDDSTAPEKKSCTKVEINFANILEEALRMNGVSNWQRTESARRRERERQKQLEDPSNEVAHSPEKAEENLEQSYLSSNCSPRRSLKHVKPLRLITSSKKNTIGFFARKNDKSSSPAKRDSDSESSEGKETIRPPAGLHVQGPKPNSSFTALKGRLKTINFSQKTFTKDNPQGTPFHIHVASKSKGSLMQECDQAEPFSSPKSKVSLQKHISLSMQKNGESATFSKKLLTLSKKPTLIQQNPTVF